MGNKKLTELQKLRKENMELKRTLSVCLDKPWVKELVKALDDIKNGKYVTEEEFFKDSPIKN